MQFVLSLVSVVLFVRGTYVRDCDAKLVEVLIACFLVIGYVVRMVKNECLPWLA